MTAVLMQLIVPLLAATLLGLAMGWLTWRWRRTRVARADWEALVERASYAELNEEVLKAERDSAAELLRSLRDQVAELERSRDLAKTGQNGAQGEIERLMGERDSDASKIAELNLQLSAEAKTKADLQDQLARAEARVAELEAQRDLETEQAVSTARGEELRAQLESAQNRAIEAAGQLAGIEVRNAELEAAAAAAEARVSELESELVAIGTRVSELEAERDSAVSERDEVWAELDLTVSAHEQALAVLKQNGLGVSGNGDGSNPAD